MAPASSHPGAQVCDILALAAPPQWRSEADALSTWSGRKTHASSHEGCPVSRRILSRKLSPLHPPGFLFIAPISCSDRVGAHDSRLISSRSSSSTRWPHVETSLLVFRQSPTNPCLPRPLPFFCSPSTEAAKPGRAFSLPPSPLYSLYSRLLADLDDNCMTSPFHVFHPHRPSPDDRTGDMYSILQR